MSCKAIIFGSIGTLAESSEMQREAFNRAFAEAGLDWHWDRDAYRDMLTAVGGRDRIADYAKARGEAVDAEALHARKTEIFDAEMLERGLTLRPGVAEVLDWAERERVPVALASTTSRDNLDAMFTALDGIGKRFALVSDASQVENAKPDPEVYSLVCERLGLAPKNCVAIEDTGVNLAAPVAVGIPTIAFPGANALGQNYSAATAVVERLDPALFAAN